MTPSLARMVMARSGILPLPIKWYSIPQCWRYERTQRGRGREHYQWNVDIWGAEGVEADAELISVLAHFFESVGLSEEDLVIRVSSRKVLEAVLGKLGISGDDFSKTCVIMDKMDKLPPEAIQTQLAEIGLDQGAVSKIQEFLAIDGLEQLSEELGEDSIAAHEIRSLFSLVESYGLEEWISFDASVVRGLAYYTGPVFEANDRSGDLRAICGGGRYDRLIGTLGGKDLPATGFGFGDMVIMELLESKGLLPVLSQGVSDVVFGMGPELRGAAMKVANQLRSRGRRVDLVLEDKRMKWVFKHADRIAADRLVMVMPDEWANGIVKIKQLSTGEESEASFEEL